MNSNILCVSGRQAADSAALVNSNLALAWPRAVGPSSSLVNCVNTTTGMKVASISVGNGVLSTIVDVSISPDGLLIAAIGTDARGQPCVTIGDGVFSNVKTSHALTKVLALDKSHVVVADANDVAHLFTVASSSSTAAASSSPSSSTTAHRSLIATHAQTIEAVVHWVAVPFVASTVLIAIVRNSHLMALRLDTNSTTNNGNSCLKKCAATTLIPTPQRLAVVVDCVASTASSTVVGDETATLWVASGREVCAASMKFDGTTATIASLCEDNRIALPQGSSNRAVVSLDAVSNRTAYCLVRPSEEQLQKATPCATHADSDDEGCEGLVSTSPSFVIKYTEASVDAFTISLPSASAAAPSSLAASAKAWAGGPLTTSVLESFTGQPIIGGGYLPERGGFVGFVTNVRQRTVGLVPMIPISPSPAAAATSIAVAGPSPASSIAPPSPAATFQRRMERAKAEMSSLSHAVPTTVEASNSVIANILRVQDEARALQRTVEGLVADSAPRALLQQLYVTFTRATARHLFLRTGTDAEAPLPLADQNKRFAERLVCLRQITVESFRGLPGSSDGHIEHSRWGVTRPIFTMLMATMGVGAYTDEAPAGETILKYCCGEQLTADAAVAAFYLIIAQKKIAILEELAPMATTLLHASGLSPSLLHWALLLYIADHEADMDVSAAFPHLLSLERTYDFGASVMPRVIDAFICAGNIEAVYLLMPSMLASSSALQHQLSANSSPVSVDDRLAVRFLLVALLKGNAGLLRTLLCLATNQPSSSASGGSWRAAAIHVAAVACASLGNVHILEGAVRGREEELLVEEALLKGVGTRGACRVFIEFLVMQRHYGRALALCESFPTSGSDAEHNAIVSLTATLRCLVPTPTTTVNRPYAFVGFSSPDTEVAMANANATAAVDTIKVDHTVIDEVAANAAALAASNAAQSGGCVRK